MLKEWITRFWVFREYWLTLSIGLFLGWLYLKFISKFVLSALAAREALAIKCIQCTGEIDHDGNVLGGDAGCFDGDNVEKYSIECPESKPVCGVELVADWFPRGFQHFKIRRECRTKVFLHWNRWLD